MTDPACGNSVQGSEERSTGIRGAKTVLVGGFSYRVDRAQITTVCWQDVEVLRRIFVTVRDDQWCEVLPVEWEETLLSHGQGFSLKALHRNSSVEFEWEGAFRIEGSGLSFKMEGRALRDMDVCRVGLVVLYPVRPLIGALLRTEGPDGSQRLRIQRELYPQAIAGGVPQGMTLPFSSLSIELPDDKGTLNCQFSGDLFELEDQRNWGDASFKAYCTPLRLGFPRSMKSGTLVRQEAEMQFSSRTIVMASRPDSAYEIKIAVPQRAHHFPDLGIVNSPVEFSRLSSSAWSHVRMDVSDLASYSHAMDCIGRMPDATKVELCTWVSEDSSADFALRDLLHRTGSRIARVLVRGLGVGLPAEDHIVRLGKLLQAADVSVPPLFTAMNGYFVELNRSYPIPRLSGVAFPFCSTVHLADRRTVAESPAVLADIVSTARTLSGQDLVSISPLALFHPSLAAVDLSPREIAVPWALAVLIEAAKSQVSSVTLAPDLIDALSTSGFPALLNQLQNWGGHVLRPLSLSPEDVYAAIVECDNQDCAHLILVNFGRSPVNVRWLGDEIRIAQMTNAQTGASIDIKGSDFVQILPETALIALASWPCHTGEEQK